MWRDIHWSIPSPLRVSDLRYPVTKGWFLCLGMGRVPSTQEPFGIPMGIKRFSNPRWGEAKDQVLGHMNRKRDLGWVTTHPSNVFPPQSVVSIHQCMTWNPEVWSISPNFLRDDLSQDKIESWSVKLKIFVKFTNCPKGKKSNTQAYCSFMHFGCWTTSSSKEYKTWGNWGHLMWW